MPVSTAYDCLCVGIAVADHLCLPIPRLPAAGELAVAERLIFSIGGCAANVAVDLARLGVRVGVAARIGADLMGQFVRQQLAAAGVDPRHLRETPGVDTSGTLIVNVTGEDRRFIHAFGANGEFDGTEVSAELIASCRVLYVGGYCAMPRCGPEAVAQLFQQARAAGVRTVLDVVIPRADDYWPWIAPVLPWTDVFLPNEDEGRLITGCHDPVTQAERFHAAGAETVVITLGGEGAVLIGQSERFRSGSFRVEFVDGTGSGDAFDAGYIYGLLQGRDPRGCVELGSALGASCVRQSGATTGVFTQPELDAFLRTNRLDFSPL